MSTFDSAFDRIKNAASSAGLDTGGAVSDPFERIAKAAASAQPGAAPGAAAGEQDLQRIAAADYQNELVIPEVLPMLPEALRFPSIQAEPREVERGLRQTMAQAAQAIATPGLRAKFFESVLDPWFAVAAPYARPIAPVMGRLASQALEPSGSGLTVDDLRTEQIAARGAAEGMAAGQQQGVTGDVARAIGQTLPQFAGVAGAIATGGAGLPVVAANIASQATLPLSAWTGGQLAYLDEIDAKRAQEALDGKELSQYSVDEMQRRATASAMIQTGTEVVGAGLAGRAIGTIGAKMVNSKVGRSALGALSERGAPIVQKAMASKAGQAGAEAFARVSQGTMRFRNGFFGDAARLVATSAAEEGAEELGAAILEAPFTEAPLSKDLSDGLYSAFIGSVAGGIGGGVGVTGAVAGRAIKNRQDAFRPETDAEIRLRQLHSDAMKARTNWTEELDDTQQAEVAVALNNLNGMNQEERGIFLRELSDRRAQIRAKVESLLAHRQDLDAALAPALEAQRTFEAGAQNREAQQAVIAEAQAALDRAEADYQAARDALAEMQLAQEQAGVPRVARRGRKIVTPAQRQQAVTDAQALVNEATRALQSARADADVAVGLELSPGQSIDPTEAVDDIRRQVEETDAELRMLTNDHMIANATYAAVSEKLSDMPMDVMQRQSDEVLSNLGRSVGVDIKPVKAPKTGGRIQREMEALGIKVVWFRPSSKKFNSPGFHTLETRGTIYLNADANMSSVRAKAYEEVFHDIQMFRPEIAQAYSQQVGLAPIYAAGAQYAEGQAESAAKGRADAFARIQAAVAAAGIEGVDVEVPAAVSRIGAARLEQEGEANAFGPTAARVGGRGVLSPLVRFAARRGLMGREVAGAMSVIDAVARAAAVEKAAGVKPDATLSPLGRTLLWMEDMSVDIPAEIEQASQPEAEQAQPAAPQAPQPQPAGVSMAREPRPLSSFTPEWREWFGDSKVVDDQGRPLVVYHGTNAQFDAFAPTSQSVNETTFGPVEVERTGIFFSNNPQFASQYGNSIIPSYLAMQNPATVTRNLVLEFADTIDAFGADRDLWIAAKNSSGWRLFDDELGRRFVAFLKNRGYDGAIFDEDLVINGESIESTTYVAFDSNQAKSVFNERPTSAPGISMSRASDADYLAAVERGDMATAQRMVDEAARTAGYTVRGVHGVASGKLEGGAFAPELLGTNTGAPSARMGFFFGSKETAVSYANKGELDTTSGRQYAERFQELARELIRKTPAKYRNEYQGSFAMELARGTEAFLPTKLDETPESFPSNNYEYFDLLSDTALFALEDASSFSRTMPDGDKFVEWVENTWLAKWDALVAESSAASISSEALVNAVLKMDNPLTYDFKGERYREESYASIIARAKANGNDSVLLLNTYDGSATPDDIKVVFSPSQIKSADPVTRDEQGNVIPLSKRFDVTTPLISFSREGDAEAASLREQIAVLQRQIRDVQNVTAAQRTNAIREVRILERRLLTAERVAEQKTLQATRAKMRVELEREAAKEDMAAADAQIAKLQTRLDSAKASVESLKQELGSLRRGENLEQRLADAEETAQRAIDFAYAIGRHSGLAAGEIEGQRKRRREVQRLTERLGQVGSALEETQATMEEEAAAAQGRIDLAYAIGRREGLVSGQVAGQKQERRVVRKLSERLAIVEERLNTAVPALREARRQIKQDAAAAQRAINFAYGMGLAKGRVQGVMEGRRQVLKRMAQREDTLQRQLFELREMSRMRADQKEQVADAVRRIASDAAKMLPVSQRGVLAVKIANAKTLAQANRIAVDAVKQAADAEVADTIKEIKALRKRLGRRGMTYTTRTRVEALLAQAEAGLKTTSGQRLRAAVQAQRGATPVLVNAVDMYSAVVDAAALVEQAGLLHSLDRQQYLAQRAARIARYDALRQDMLNNMSGRPTLAEADRADKAATIPFYRRVGRANSDIYTMMLELEGSDAGVLNNLLVSAQAGKGEASLEHASILRQIVPALQAAGYTSIDDYALKNGLLGEASANLRTVRMGGQDVTLPVGTILSVAAMDDETLALFPDTPGTAGQGITFAGAETTKTFYPSRQDIEAIRSGLSAQERGIVDAMKTVLETQIRDRVMDAVFAVEGDQPPVVQNYWPRVRLAKQKGDASNLNATAGNLVRGALTNVGFAQARTGGTEPLIYRDAFQTWERHVQVALDMIHMAQPYRDAATVLTDPAVVAGIDRQFGNGTAEMVLAVFSNGVGATARSNPTIIDKLTNNVTGAVLALRPRTLAKVLVGGQMRLASEIPLGYWSKGVARAASRLRNPLAWDARVEEIHSLNGYFSRRHQMHMRSIISGSLSDADRVRISTAWNSMIDSFRAAGQNLAAAQLTDAAGRFKDASNGANMMIASVVDMLRYMDEQIMLAAVEARLAEIEDEGILTGQDALREAALRAERDFRRTQNASDEFDDSLLSAYNRVKGASGWRIFFPFSSDPVKARNQIRRAFISGDRRLETGLAIGANMAASTIIGAASLATTGYLVSLVAGLFGGDGPSDEQEKEAMEEAKRLPIGVMNEVMSSTLGYLGIVLGWVTSAIEFRRAPFTPIAVRPVEQVIREATGPKPIPERVVAALLAASQFAGFPMYGLYQFVRDFMPKPEREKSSTTKEPQSPRDRLMERIERRRREIERARQGGAAVR